MAQIVVLQPSNKGFRPFGGSGLVYEDVIWVPAGATVAFTSITSTASFGNASGASTKRGENAGAGLRVGLSGQLVQANSYDALGLFDAAGAAQPGIYATWFGFHTAPGKVSVRAGDTSLSTTYAYVAGTDTLTVELWPDSVRYFVNTTEVYRTATPAPAAYYVAGVNMYCSDITWRDVKIAALNLLSR